MSEEEKLPVDDNISIIDHTTIYHTTKWWCEVVLGNMYGHDKIMVYQWQFVQSKNRWIRKQKFTVNFEKDWILVKDAVEKYLPKIKVIS